MTMTINQTYGPNVSPVLSRCPTFTAAHTNETSSKPLDKTAARITKNSVWVDNLRPHWCKPPQYIITTGE